MSVNSDKLQKALEGFDSLSQALVETGEKANEAMVKSFNLTQDEALAQIDNMQGVIEGLNADAAELVTRADSLFVAASQPGLDSGVADSLSNVAVSCIDGAQQTIQQASYYIAQGTEFTKLVQSSAAKTTEVATEGGNWFTALFGDLNLGGGDLWGQILLQALIGFVLVFTVLVLLIFIMKGMGWIFTRQKKAAKVAESGAVAVAADEHDAITDQEIAAAIITALKLYKSNLHDQESEMLTISRITRAYSPWSSKIHGLTQLPERK